MANWSSGKGGYGRKGKGAATDGDADKRVAVEDYSMTDEERGLRLAWLSDRVLDAGGDMQSNRPEQFRTLSEPDQRQVKEIEGACRAHGDGWEDRLREKSKAWRRDGHTAPNVETWVF